MSPTPLSHYPDRSVQYMQQPELVFAEIYRVLKPGGVCIMTFSNRMFFTKVRANGVPFCALRGFFLNVDRGAVFLVCGCNNFIYPLLAAKPGFQLLRGCVASHPLGLDSPF
jgi:SAM-dependent methyltransferase